MCVCVLSIEIERMGEQEGEREMADVCGRGQREKRLCEVEK